MPVEIRVPEMGESIVEAIVGKWLKQEGDVVSAGEPVVELETEKVNLEVTAPQEGVLEKILKAESETVTVGEVLGTVGERVGERREAVGAMAQPSALARTAQPSAAQPGEIPSTPLYERGARGDFPSQREVPEAAEEAIPQEEPLVTPLARSIAARHGIDLSQVKGTGRGGRITHEDVEEYLSKAQEQTGRAPAAAERPRERPVVRGAPERVPEVETPPPPSPRGDGAISAPPAAESVKEKPAPGRYEERMRLSRRRQTIAKRLVEAHQTAVMATTYNEIDMSAVIELRSRRRTAFKERHGVDLGFMSFFVKAVVGALRFFPQFNAELEEDELVLKYYYDIGITVGSEEGLVVPVLQNADKKTFAEVEAAIADMVVRTQEHRLTLEELQGGTFTITNGGVFGSLLSTPILNPPQVGILGMHRITERPVAVNGAVVIRPMMYVALTYDHRAVDGRDAVQFLVRVKELVEDPTRLLLEV